MTDAKKEQAGRLARWTECLGPECSEGTGQGRVQDEAEQGPSALLRQEPSKSLVSFLLLVIVGASCSKLGLKVSPVGATHWGGWRHLNDEVLLAYALESLAEFHRVQGLVGVAM